jgi:PKD repeat protein
VKWIDGTILLNPDICAPEDTITVSGTAKYNSDFNNLPVDNGDVTIEIEGTSISGTTKTDAEGKYQKELNAPVDCKTYKITVDIEDSEGYGLKDGEKLEAILEVRSLAVTIDLNPDYCIGGHDVMVSGKVKDPDYAVSGASVTISIDGTTDTWDVFTSGNGVYSTTIQAPNPTVKTDYTVTATAIKDELMGSASDSLTVDIDTDGDGYGDDEDEDDDGDGVDDDTEESYGSDPKDSTSLPDVDPTAYIAGEDKTIYEGDSVTFDGTGSSDQYGGTITNYDWDFGDGSTDTGEDPTHQFTDVGNYTVKLTVKDNDNNLAEDTIKVNVMNKPPEAKLSCDKTSEETDKSVNFDATGSNCINVDTIESYEWDWNYDGADFNPSGDTGAEQTHEWSSKGNYVIAVRVTDDDGSTDIATYTIKIKEAEDGGILGGSSSDSGSNVALIAIIIVVVVVIILAVVFVMKRKGGNKPPETKKDERVQTAPKQAPPQNQPPSSQQERDWNWDFRD